MSVKQHRLKGGGVAWHAYGSGGSYARRKVYLGSFATRDEAAEMVECWNRSGAWDDEVRSSRFPAGEREGARS